MKEADDFLKDPTAKNARKLNRAMKRQKRREYRSPDIDVLRATDGTMNIFVYR